MNYDELNKTGIYNYRLIYHNPRYINEKNVLFGKMFDDREIHVLNKSTGICVKCFSREKQG